MDVGAELLRAIQGDPQAALVLADYLEERADPRGELLRLAYALTREIDVPRRLERERWLRSLLAEGVHPVGPYEAVTLAQGVELVLAWIPPGTFLMGSPPDEAGRQGDEDLHRVTLSQGFWLGGYPVTQAQWAAVVGGNPSRVKGEDRPVERVSWEDCQQFCQELSAREGRRCGLPTEAQWEYACRAGTTTRFHFGDTITPELANYRGNHAYGTGGRGVYSRQTTPAGSFPANGWGLRDLHGNVWEWCQDAYGPYLKSDIEDPQGATAAGNRVLRGGSWDNSPRGCRAAHRSSLAPGRRSHDIGFRVCHRPS
jgi:uncharacterized protein (TIGR02996 family)